MSVIAFPQRRHELASAADRSRSWSHDEMQQLLALSASLAARGLTAAVAQLGISARPKAAIRNSTN